MPRDPVNAPGIQPEMADEHFDGPYARDTHREGLGGDHARGDHETVVDERDSQDVDDSSIGKASE